MTDILEFTVSQTDKLPQIDMSYDPGKGYDAVNELMRAMILRVIEDLNAGGELREDAIEYMFSEDYEYIYSFHSICSHLGMDPDKTRIQILNSKHRISTRRRAA